MMNKAPVLAVAVVAAAVLAWLGVTRVATASDPSAPDETVQIRGGFGFRPNRIVFSDFRFHPGNTKVDSGATVAWEDAGDFPEGHSISIVNAADLPADIDAVFACGEPGTVCEPFFAGHFPDETTVVSVLNQGAPGLDTPGDSLLLLPEDGSVSAVISADPGTILSYMCVFHPWMQGTIEVEEADED